MKNIVIVGGSHGIGASLLQKLSDNSLYSVTNISRTEPTVLGSYTHVEGDVRNEIPALNLDEIHGLVYCPGTINLKPFHRLTETDFKEDLEVNLFGAIRAIQAFLKPMKAAKSASVVLFSTVAVGQGMPFHSSVSAAKGAVEGLTRSLAAEYGQNNIRFNCIAPSITETPLAEKLLSDDKRKEASARRHPLGRYGQPSDLASMAEFLISENASWTTGQVFHVDGGLSKIKMV